MTRSNVNVSTWNCFYLLLIKSFSLYQIKTFHLFYVSLKLNWHILCNLEHIPIKNFLLGIIQLKLTKSCLKTIYCIISGFMLNLIPHIFIQILQILIHHENILDNAYHFFVLNLKYSLNNLVYSSAIIFQQCKSKMICRWTENVYSLNCPLFSSII